MSCRACAAPSGLGPIRPGPAKPSAVRGRAGKPRRRGVQGAGGKSCGRFPASGRGSSGAEGEKPVAGGAAWCRSCGLAGRGAGERRGPRGRVRVGGRGREMGAESSDTVPPPSACVISSAEAGKLMERDKASPVAPVYTLLIRARELVVPIFQRSRCLQPESAPCHQGKYAYSSAALDEEGSLPFFSPCAAPRAAARCEDADPS